MDWYAILGLNQNSTIDEVKKAYRKKAMEFHPDRYKGSDASAKFSLINDAYKALTDPSYKPNKPKPQPAPARPVSRPQNRKQKWYADHHQEREVDLWARFKSSDPWAGYWKEYERLKKEMVYEDPDLFWQRLDEWVASNITAKRP